MRVPLIVLIIPCLSESFSKKFSVLKKCKNIYAYPTLPVT